MTHPEWIVSAVQHLAMPAEAQVRYLTDKGVAPSADELALEFDDALAGASLSAVVEDRLGSLAAYLSRMSGPQHASLWTTEALRVRSEWAEVRRLAQQALRAMGVGG